MKIDYNRIAFALAFIVVSILIALGKLPPSTLAFFAGHLLPSPMGTTASPGASS